MLLSTHCSHCPAVLDSLAKLVKQGALTSLEIINLELAPETANDLGVKTVPWVRIGWFEIEGLHSMNELKHIVELASAEDGALEYLSELLVQGKVMKVLDLVDRHHQVIEYLIRLLSNGDEKMNVRLGIGVVMEQYASVDWFVRYIPMLTAMVVHHDSRVRADICHYLSLTENAEVIPVITTLLKDKNEDVREVARESLEELRQAE